MQALISSYRAGQWIGVRMTLFETRPSPILCGCVQVQVNEKLKKYFLLSRITFPIASFIFQESSVIRSYSVS